MQTEIATAGISTIGTEKLGASGASDLAIASATLQPNRLENNTNWFLEYGVDIFLIICFIAVYLVKPDPELSLAKTNSEEKPNELEKMLVTESDEASNVLEKSDNSIKSDNSEVSK